MVVGGGQVALRKVNTLLEHKANVEVISPDLCPELSRAAQSKEIRVVSRGYQDGDIEGAFIVIVATDDSNINLKVVTEAQRRAILVNVVDDAENSDFILPSYMRRGDVIIAVSTGGRSPALARKIRTTLEEDFGDEYAALALLIDDVRMEIKQREIKISNDVWQKALDLDLLRDLLRKGDEEKARAVLFSNLEVRPE